MAETQQFLKKTEMLNYLNQLKIEYKYYEHPPVFTVEEMLNNMKLEKAPLIKNLFYVDKKHNYYLIAAKSDTKVEKNFWKNINLAPGNIRFCPEEQTLNVIKCQKGHLNAFSLVNDNEKKVKLIIDKNLESHEYWSFHPMENDATVELKQSEFKKYLSLIGHDFVLAKLDEVEEADKKAQIQQQQKEQENSHETKLKLTVKKEEDLSEWYKQIITKSELIEYYDVSGCYILRPNAYTIWENIQKFFDNLIKQNDVQNAYFPMFVTEKALNKEKEHVEGFSPEVAWVTRSGSTDLPEPIAVRPTSETIMYPAYSKWIKSHRDLPLKLNQWTNVVRWEFKDPTPFIRTREFLWQEGHTAHATKEEADEQTYTILDFYRRVYEEVLAVPVIKGVKSEGEKFPGALYTTTIETCIPTNGRAVQAATSHQLGQNFSKMFNISFLNSKKENTFVWQTSWGLTTRSIGVMVLYHGDNQGLVLPPAVASVQVVIIPIIKTGIDSEQLLQNAHQLKNKLKAAGIRVFVDDRDHQTSGWKYNHWEMKGVPLRFELGPADLDKNEVRAVWRVNGFKEQISQDVVVEATLERFEKIYNIMFENSKKKFAEKQKKANNWQEFMTSLNTRNIVNTPWCNTQQCEKNVKDRSGLESKLAENESGLSGSAKSLCIPLEQEKLEENAVCFACGGKAQVRVFWGRSY
ncbi:prolyl-tRNA synthetase family protein, putative [Ichthyophthirius multifiliis]|uniref:proline--tRNA ligase n=1 Tax=Ichthyophthirius multifiliis TaxID=5932 RepID=G0QLC2_ICHMU|nr:prolyl-tRNA synthetase family protein, putative [Ichthyophthirius multifiliis]EGR33982.1 prolyl-tRNA synthetase family protein, putative [Ichthyophthirius multifiliis]|eukprot:XP_004039286.1 prolyl-tRNA synthetase family protein, putative [Ichthyophthirius multifiliis]